MRVSWLRAGEEDESSREVDEVIPITAIYAHMLSIYGHINSHGILFYSVSQEI